MLYTGKKWIFTYYGKSESNLPSYSAINGDTGITPQNDISIFFNPTAKIINIAIALVCLLGLLGNGRVIWLLGFNIKRNPFTIYVMNLSIADFGALTCLLSIASIVIASNGHEISLAIGICIFIILQLFCLTYSSSEFLLTIISIDKCVAVFFPIWHRCHRPPYLSAVACAIIWIISFLLTGIRFPLTYIYNLPNILFILHLIVEVLFGTPPMVICTLILFVKVCCKLKQHQGGKRIIAVLLTLLCFLPLNVSFIIYVLVPDFHVSLLIWIAFACASVNSSINPLIYFLVGRRQKKGRAKVSMKVALERVFKDEQVAVEEGTPMEEIHA